jgi:hypothetical protein
MSELTSFVKKIEICRKQWDELAAQVSGLVQDALEPLENQRIMSMNIQMQSMSNQIHTVLHPLAEKLSVKMAAVDPVTGKNRYGPTSVAKLQAAVDELQTLTNLIDQTQPNLNKLIEKWQSEHRDHNVDTVAINTTGKTVVEGIPASEVITVYTDIPLPPVLAVNTEPLHEIADSVRQQQQKERERLTALNAEVHNSLTNMCSTLDRLSYVTEIVDECTQQIVVSMIL